MKMSQTKKTERKPHPISEIEIRPSTLPDVAQPSYAATKDQSEPIIAEEGVPFDIPRAVAAQVARFEA